MGKTLIICEKGSQVEFFSNTKYAKRNLSKSPNAQVVGDYIFMAATGHTMGLNHLLANTKWEEDRDIEFLNKKDIVSNFALTSDRAAIGKAIIKEMQRSDVTEIVSCVDPDAEGEVIFATLLEKANVSGKKITRAWFTEQTPEGAVKGVDNRKDIDTPLFKNLKNRGFFRTVSDYETGTNLSVSAIMASKRNGGDTNLSLGRVQSVLLGIINDRYIINQNFDSITTYKPKVTIDGKKFIFKDLEFKTEAELQKYIDSNMKDAEYTLTSNKRNGTEEYPGGWTKSSIEIWGNAYREAGKKIFASGHEVGNRKDGILQVMYDKGYLSYPGTSEKAIGTAEAVELANNHGNKVHYGVKIGDKYLYTKNIKKSPAGGHGHLHPTSKVPGPSDLTKKERIVYDEVSRNTFAHFMPKPKTVTVSFSLTFKDKDGQVQKSSPVSFKALKDEGYLKIYPIKNYKYTLTEVLDMELSAPKIGKSTKIETHEVTTKPPEIFTEDTLGTVMEDIAIIYDDKEMKKLFRTKNEVGESVNIGIGANNTKDAHIQKLIDKGFIMKKGKKYIPTAKGTSMIEQLRAAGLKIQELENFARLEKIMQELQNDGKEPYDLYVELEKDILNDIEKLKSSTFKVAYQTTGVKPKGAKSTFTGETLKNVTCPKCKTKTSMEFKTGKGKKGPLSVVECSSCGERTFLVIGDKALNKTQATKWLTGKPVELKKVTWKSGKTSDANVFYNFDTDKMEFVQEEKVFEKNGAWIYKSHYLKKSTKVGTEEVKISEAQMKKLVDNGEVTIKKVKYKAKITDKGLKFINLEKA